MHNLNEIVHGKFGHLVYVYVSITEIKNLRIFGEEHGLSSFDTFTTGVQNSVYFIDKNHSILLVHIFFVPSLISAIVVAFLRRTGCQPLQGPSGHLDFE